MAKKTTKKPAKRYVVGRARGWCVFDGPVGAMRTERLSLSSARLVAKEVGGDATIYELVPVAGGRTNAKR